MIDQIFSRYYPVALTLLRLVAGLLFWERGARKIFGILGGNAVDPFTLLWFAGMLEVCGGLLILLGLFTQPTAFVLSGEMAVAFFIGHVPRGVGFWPVQNQGEPAVLYCFIFLFLATAGPGKLSLDGLIFRKSSSG